MQTIVELVTPKQSAADLDGALQRFDGKYREIIDRGFTVSLPDNPMGTLRFLATEMIEELGLPVPPGRVLLHLNTFHAKEALDQILSAAIDLGITNLMVVSGDGSERLPRLSPRDLSCDCVTVTAVELVSYILSAYQGSFKCGVAFNPYEPFEHEYGKLKRKLKAGASFVATQPVIEKHPNVDALAELDVKTFVGAWMSRNIKALSDCVGYPLAEDLGYDPLRNRAALREKYPMMGVYFCAVQPEIKLEDLM